jgi:hypothetical protein
MDAPDSKKRGRPPHTMEYFKEKSEKYKRICTEVVTTIATIKTKFLAMQKQVDKDKKTIEELHVELDNADAFNEENLIRIDEITDEKNKWHHASIICEMKMKQMEGVDSEMEHMDDNEIIQTLQKMECGIARLKTELTTRQIRGNVKHYVLPECFGCISVRKPHMMCMQCSSLVCEKCSISRGEAASECGLCRQKTMYKVPTEAMAPVYEK